MESPRPALYEGLTKCCYGPCSAVYCLVILNTIWLQASRANNVFAFVDICVFKDQETTRSTRVKGIGMNLVIG